MNENKTVRAWGMEHYIDGILPQTHSDLDWLIQEYSLGYELGSWKPVEVIIRKVKKNERK